MLVLLVDQSFPFCHRLVLLNQQRVAFSFSERWPLSLVQRCPMVNMLTRGCDARAYGEFYGFMKFIFVGWTEMCSRHGDTAKLNIDGAGILFYFYWSTYLTKAWR